MKKILIAATAVIVVVGAAAAAWLLLRDDDEATARGTCDRVTYELSADPDDGGLEASFELQSEAPAETWQVVLAADGEDLFDGERTTDEDGEIDLDVVVPDDAASFEVAATPAGGATCTATLDR